MIGINQPVPPNRDKKMDSRANETPTNNKNYKNMNGYELSTKTISLQFGWYTAFADDNRLNTEAIKILKAEGWVEDEKRSKCQNSHGFNWIVLIRQIIE